MKVYSGYFGLDRGSSEGTERCRVSLPIADALVVCLVCICMCIICAGVGGEM